MKRLIFSLIIAALAVAACAEKPRRDARSRALPPPQAIFNLSYAEAIAGAPAGPVIEVYARDLLPLTLAELVAPDGTVSQAQAIDRQVEAPPSGGLRPEIGVGVAGGSSGGIRSSGVIISLPITGTSGPPRGPSFVESRAVLAVTDPASYRADWQGYSVRLRLGAPPGDTKHLTLDAPSPLARPVSSQR